MLIYGLVCAVIALVLLLDLVWHIPRIPVLSQVRNEDSPLPRLSVIIPACNEEGTIRKGLASVLGQEYPDLEVVLVNDRSTDHTGEIMAAMASEYPGRIQVITVQSLPPGWLGKNHALWVGTQAATGSWYLFTDADVLLSPGCVHRAVAEAEAKRLDHLVLTPRLLSRAFWLRGMICYFLSAWFARSRVHAVNDPKQRKAGLGMGSFNLVRAEAYRASGGHQAISLRPDDDLRLGQRLKWMGFAQRAYIGADLVAVEWYETLGGFVRGLEKNMHSQFRYSAWIAAANIVFVLSYWVVPVILALLLSGPVRWAFAAAFAMQGLHLILANRTSGRLMEGWRYVPLLPVLTLIFLFTAVRAVLLTYWRGGITWRGTFYPLADLRKQTGLE